MPVETLTEDQLKMILTHISQQDQQAFAEFYHYFETRLYRFIHTKISDPFEAADILHEVFLDVWNQAGRFKGQAKVSTWLFSIANFKAIDKLRKKKPDALDDQQINQIADETAHSEHYIEASQNQRQVQHCIDTLKPAHRIVMQLTFFEELSYKEIAVIEDCPENTVKTRMFHAKQAMKRCLTRLFERKHS